MMPSHVQLRGTAGSPVRFSDVLSPPEILSDGPPLLNSSSHLQVCYQNPLSFCSSSSSVSSSLTLLLPASSSFQLLLLAELTSYQPNHRSHSAYYWPLFCLFSFFWNRSLTCSADSSFRTFTSSVLLYVHIRIKPPEALLSFPSGVLITADPPFFSPSCSPTLWFSCQSSSSKSFTLICPLHGSGTRTQTLDYAPLWSHFVAVIQFP